MVGELQCDAMGIRAGPGQARGLFPELKGIIHSVFLYKLIMDRNKTSELEMSPLVRFWLGKMLAQDKLSYQPQGGRQREVGILVTTVSIYTDIHVFRYHRSCGVSSPAVIYTSIP